MSGINENSYQLVESHYQLMQDLIDIREKQNLSQEEVGTRMGTSQSTVALFESYDSNPTLGTIRRYALAVGAKIIHQVIETDRHEWN